MFASQGLRVLLRLTSVAMVSTCAAPAPYFVLSSHALLHARLLLVVQSLPEVAGKWQLVEICVGPPPLELASPADLSEDGATCSLTSAPASRDVAASVVPCTAARLAGAPDGALVVHV